MAVNYLGVGDQGRGGAEPGSPAPFAGRGSGGGLADRLAAHTGPRGAGLPGRPVRKSASSSGTSAGMPVTTSPATACCSRRWVRCSGSVPVAALCALASTVSVRRPGRGGFRRGRPLGHRSSRWRPLGTSGRAAWHSRWASRWRWRRASRCAAAIPRLGRPGWAVRRCRPGRRPCCWAWRGWSVSLHLRAPRRCWCSGLPAAGVVLPWRCCSPKAAPSRSRCFPSSPRSRSTLAFLRALPREGGPAADRRRPLPAGVPGLSRRSNADRQQHRALRGSAGGAAAAVCRRERRPGGPWGRLTPRAVLALALMAVWVLWPVRETEAVAGSTGGPAPPLQAADPVPRTAARAGRSGSRCP